MFEEKEYGKIIEYQEFESILISQDKSTIWRQEFGEEEEKKDEVKHSYELPERVINNKDTPV
jgi:hypothetical protein